MLIVAAAAAFTPFAASAYPEGAPWTALDDPGGPCASCHFGNPQIKESAALALEVPDTRFMPGKTYSLTLRFAPEAAKVGGFLAVFVRDVGDAGLTKASADLEARGPAVRSTAAKPVQDLAGTTWSFDWTVPETPGPVILQIAANAGNNDASPLGDVVHLKKLTLEVERDAE